MLKTTIPKTPLGVSPKTLFTTLNTLQEVIELAESKLPITTKNELHTVLLTYHNTLLKQLEKPTCK